MYYVHTGHGIINLTPVYSIISSFETTLCLCAHVYLVPLSYICVKAARISELEEQEIFLSIPTLRAPPP